MLNPYLVSFFFFLFPNKQVLAAPATSTSSLKAALVYNWQGETAGTSCDSSTRGHALEVAKALDERYLEIKQFPEKHPVNDGTVYFQVGPLMFREQKTSATAPAGWTNDPVGWEDVYRNYMVIKNTPVDERWLLLNRDAHALATQDRRRLRNNINVELNHESSPFILSALTVTEACLKSVGCLKPVFDNPTARFIDSNLIYRSFAALIEKARSPGNKVKVIQMFRNRLKDDFAYNFGFVASTAVKRLGPAHFQVSLIAGPFRGFERTLEKAINSAWRSTRFQVVVKWVDEGKDAFRLVVDEGSGGNMVTDRVQRKIHLYQGNQFRNLAHEIGHVLGFQDRYFDAWDSGSCRYLTEVHPGDIMSEGKTGVATNDEWATLDAAYPYARIGAR